MTQKRNFEVTETPRIPLLSIVLGYGPMLPFAAGAVLAWILSGSAAMLVRDLTLLWGCAILLFLSGVRRGLSFRTPGGPTVWQIGTMLWLFLVGLVSLPLIPGRICPVLLTLGYLSIAVLDPVAAARAEAPLFFARLRPLQMIIPVASLIALAALPR